jgi:starch phosphorylase
MLRIMKIQHIPLERFHEKFTVQLNDTHPAIAVAELMRLLLDDYGLSWNEAWSITQRTFAYTNHTLLPEALERWPIDMFGRLLPRHLEIIYEINAHFLDEVRLRFLGDDDRVSRMSLIDESEGRYIRMAHLACVGSYAINGVAGLHSELLKSDVLKDFYELWPEKFSNKTNGVTPRRFVKLSNPGLSGLITDVIGDEWPKELDQLKQLEPYAEDKAFGEKWRNVKLANKETFATFAKERTGITINPSSMFDIQVKRIHEYKRQHLNIFYVIALYHHLKNNRHLDMQPRTFIFGGKAAPGYHIAKLMIKLITSVGDMVNRDRSIRDLIKVVYLPNFNVSNGHLVYPAAELSEQISTAGKEASGTGNMKFCMNGALTIGTLDGANIEIRNAVGAENFFLFGMNAEEVYALRNAGYNPMNYYQNNSELKGVIELVRAGFFSRGDGEMFQPLIDGLLHQDQYMVLADFESYLDCQAQVDQAYADKEHWTRMSILNTARSGPFSSDRTIGEYSNEIWNLDPVSIQLINQDEVNVGILQ